MEDKKDRQFYAQPRNHLNRGREDDSSGFKMEAKIVVRTDMPVARGAALRAGFWSQVVPASMGKFGR